jgi:hypothetical protein
MDTTSKSPLSGAGVPFDFSGYEIDACFDKRGRFRLGKLRALQQEKVLQVSLLVYHGVAVTDSGDVYQFVTPIHPISIVKSRRASWGYYLMTIAYRYEGTAYKHAFRFIRHSNGGLSGRLYPNPTRRSGAK